jgi:hypothetical protein
MTWCNMQVIRYLHIQVGKEISWPYKQSTNTAMFKFTAHVFNNCYITNFLITNELCVHPYLWWTLKRTEPLLSLVLGGTISTLHLTASLLAHYLNPYLLPYELIWESLWKQLTTVHKLFLAYFHKLSVIAYENNL